MDPSTVSTDERPAETQRPEHATRNRRLARLSVVVLVLLLLAVAYRSGLLAEVSEPRLLAHKLVAMGFWGYVVFVLAYWALQPFGVPGTVFVVAAPLIWPWQKAFFLSMIGTMGASVVGFSFARFVAREWVSTHVPARFKKYDDALERTAFQTVVVLRLVFWMPQALHAFLGVSKVPFWTHFWGSLVGYIVPLLVVSYLGAEMFDESGHFRTPSWPVIVVVLLVSVVFAALLRCLDPKPASDDSMTRSG